MCLIPCRTYLRTTASAEATARPPRSSRLPCCRVRLRSRHGHRDLRRARRSHRDHCGRHGHRSRQAPTVATKATASAAVAAASAEAAARTTAVAAKATARPPRSSRPPKPPRPLRPPPREPPARSSRPPACDRSATHLHERIDHPSSRSSSRALSAESCGTSFCACCRAPRPSPRHPRPHRHGACRHPRAPDAAHDILLFRLNQQLIEGTKRMPRLGRPSPSPPSWLELKQVQHEPGPCALSPPPRPPRPATWWLRSRRAARFTLSTADHRGPRLQAPPASPPQAFNLGLLGSLGYDLFRLLSRFICLDALRPRRYQPQALRLNGSGGLGLFDNSCSLPCSSFSLYSDMRSSHAWPLCH